MKTDADVCSRFSCTSSWRLLVPPAAPPCASPPRPEDFPTPPLARVAVQPGLQSWAALKALFVALYGPR